VAADRSSDLLPIIAAARSDIITLAKGAFFGHSSTRAHTNHSCGFSVIDRTDGEHKEEKEPRLLLQWDA
jgi:hypothetical protein